MTEEIVRLARTWIGTPYRHGASTWGAGADCLGLLRGIWRTRYGCEPEPIPPYAPDWDETTRDERLWQAACRHLDAVGLSAMRPGDVVLMRMRRAGPAKHLGILAADALGSATLIHAYGGIGVVESPLGETWRRRIVAAFRFRGGA